MDVIESDRAVLTAQMDSAQMRYRQLDAAVRLYRALGGGWQP
jgi:outer membrane protein TolC